MAEKIVVKAEKKESGNKNSNRRLRAAGKVPVVVYGGGTESVAAVADLVSRAQQGDRRRVVRVRRLLRR